jgi:LmbE family N-acetylglucosaminyl deacetylase
MWKQRRSGHEVFLLTLTRGGATKQRHRLGYTIDEMGEVRYREMLDVEKVLDLNGMTVLDLPDSGLKEMDPREIEVVIADEIRRVQPDVIVSYAVYGVSGFHDHLVTHAVVKRVFVELRQTLPNLRRLAMLTISDDNPYVAESGFNLQTSTRQEIDCIVELADEDRQKFLAALDCYKTYQEPIRNSNVVNVIGHHVPFEIFDEQHDPPLSDLFENLVEK